MCVPKGYGRGESSLGLEKKIRRDLIKLKREIYSRKPLGKSEKRDKGRGEERKDRNSDW